MATDGRQSNDQTTIGVEPRIDVEALRLEGKAHLQAGAYYQARIAFEAALAIKPGSNDLLKLREQAIFSAGLSAAHEKKLGRRPNLVNPSTYNERILHRIIHDRSPILKTLCDKVAVRDFITARVGDGYNVPITGVWARAEDIDWAVLPDSFVIKPSHASGQYVMVRDKSTCDRAAILEEAESWLRRDFGRRVYEWGYIGLPRRLIVEPILQPPDGKPLIEVHVHVFGGRVGIIRPWTGAKKTPERRGVWCTRDLRPLEIEADDARTERVDIEPSIRDTLVAVAEKAAASFSHLRVDFYLTRDGLKIGELTPYVGGGRALLKPPERDAQLGRLWSGDFELLDIPRYVDKAVR